ncbi:MAG: M28 family peptidase, partial [Verrucomicrobiota bacterium]
NLDMVGRYDKALVLQGTGSSPVWLNMIERANLPIGLNIKTQADAYLPTDATSFYINEVPILSGFTGAHEDYHTPRDTPDKLNYPATAEIGHFFQRLTMLLTKSGDPIAYKAMEKPKDMGRRARLRAYLGTIPDYSQGKAKGLKLAGVAKDGPADKAGLRAKDVVTRLGAKKIENIYDYTFAIEGLKIGEPIEAVVIRGDQEITLTITPGSRD